MKLLAFFWTILWVFLGYAAFMPVLSLSYGTGIYFYFAIYFLVLSFAFKFSKDNFGDIKTEVSYNSLTLGIAGLSFIVMILGSVYSWGLFHSNEYRNLIGNVEKKEFTANISPVSPEQMITVDSEIAHRVGSKVLGEDPGLGSRCELGDFYMQVVNGQLYWIAPLVHSGFWKWLNNDGTPGYVVVSSTNERDYRLVKEINGKPVKIKYQPNAYFSQDLERHIYMSGYMSQGLTDYTFEVDDQWNPYWTVTRYDSKIGFGGDEATGIVVVNPETGFIEPYDVNNAPSWTDRIHPEKFVKSQIYDWGDFVQGYLNWSGKDKLHPADETSLVLGSDGQIYYYVGMQSKGADQSTVGFMMVNCRTKSSVWIHQAGATEIAARASAEGIVQQMNYVGSEGITYNIGGHPTYEFLLKDKSGLMKLIALVNVHDHNVVGYGADRLSAIRMYTTKMNSKGNAVVGQTSDLKEVLLRTKISRINAEVNNGMTTYFFLVDGLNKQLLGTSSNSSEFALSIPGDSVEVSFIDSENFEIEVSVFDNLAIGFTKNAPQLLKEVQDQKILDTQLTKNQEKVADQKWENLSPEQKQKILDNNN
ncbi:hypothetical protein KA405_01005 [Patescibacteria group bacterium]|nr:hypothetical protein [Patescibacteria group bacterium]